MPPSIEGTTTTWEQDATVTLQGSGFGASQGDSVLVFYCENAGAFEVIPESWDDTTIEALIPGDSSVIGEIAWFAVRLEGEGAGAVSDRNTILAEATTITEWPSGTILWARPGTVEAGVLAE